MQTLTKIRLAAAGMIVTGLILLAMAFPKEVTLIADGETYELSVWGFMVEDALEAAGVETLEIDLVEPGLEEKLEQGMEIEVTRSITIILDLPKGREEFQTTDRILADIIAPFLDEIGTDNFRIVSDGTWTSPDLSLINTTREVHTFIIHPAKEMQIKDGTRTHKINTSATFLFEAIEEMGLEFRVEDQFSASLDAHIDEVNPVELVRAKLFTVLSSGIELEGLALANTVGEALITIGLPLTGLDQSIPPEETPLLSGQTIQIINVTEEVFIEENPIPFETIWQGTAEMDIDQTGVVQAGEYGIEARRIRVQYQEGVEVSRVVEDEWLAKAPVTRINGYGTNITVRTLSVPGGQIEYWRAVNVYATSYSASGGGRPPDDPNYGRMYNGEFVQQGYCAVLRSWYAAMGGSYVYVPGYGTCKIADIGGGIPGKHWIDLGYTDEDYVPWHQNLTIYFLTPVPPAESILWVLP